MKKAPKVQTLTKVLHSEGLDRFVALEAIDTISVAHRPLLLHGSSVLHISFSNKNDMDRYVQVRLKDADGYIVTGKTVTCQFHGGSAITELSAEERYLGHHGFYEIAS